MIQTLAGPVVMLAAEGAAGGVVSADFELFSVQAVIALVTLTALELVLGVDNLIFLAILAGKLPEKSRPRVRTIGLLLAMAQRIALLLAVAWLIGLDKHALFAAFGREFTAKDLILIAGGLFLIGKATTEIHDKVEGDPTVRVRERASASMGMVLVQIVLIDAVFSVDSILTAVGLVPKHIEIMVAAIVLSVAAMIFLAGPLSRFVEKHPSVKMLALSILVLIGVLLVAEGLGQEFPRGYVYFAMAFSLVVELLNLRAAKVRARKYAAAEPSEG